MDDWVRTRPGVGTLSWLDLLRRMNDLSTLPEIKRTEVHRRRVLVAEDNDVLRAQLKTLLAEEADLEVDVTEDGKQALAALCRQNYSIFVTDLKMPGLSGMQLLQEIQQRRIPVTVIVLTGYGSIDQSVQAIRSGAYDFLTKPIDIEHLRLVIRRALRDRALQDEVASLREQLQERFSFRNLISKSPKMLAVFELVANIAHTTSTVLIEGATGTGKEQIARAIHQTSSAIRSGPMVAVNCAALPETLLESELFGHERGAFTGAISQRKGRFEQANGGTLFLDEVGEIPLPMQAKLLRVLQERQFERVGGEQPIEVDVRIIAATNKSLKKLVKRGRFREDLYYRLNVVRIELPRLRDRPEDIPLLAMHFAQKFAGKGQHPKAISPKAMEVLLNHSWPGNVRELENAIERATVTCLADEIGPEHLPAEVFAAQPATIAPRIDLRKPLPDLTRQVVVDLERRYLRRALQHTRGNVSKCAKICGLSRRSVTAKLSEYGIKKEEFMEN